MAGKKSLKGRRKKFVARYLETGKIGQSTLDAGFKNTKYGTELLRIPEVAEALDDALRAKDITNDLVAQKIREGLDATYPQKKAPNGQVVQARDPDYLTRGTYVDRILKVRGQLAPERQERTERKIVLVLTPDMMKGLVDSDAITQKEIKSLQTGPEKVEEGVLEGILDAGNPDDGQAVEPASDFGSSGQERKERPKARAGRKGRRLAQ